MSILQYAKFRHLNWVNKAGVFFSRLSVRLMKALINLMVLMHEQGVNIDSADRQNENIPATLA